jgi:hypothetical protein
VVAAAAPAVTRRVTLGDAKRPVIGATLNVRASTERVVMTRSCCPSCRLRFSRATAAHLKACPFCAQPLDELPASAALGFKRIAVDGLVSTEAAAIAVALPVPQDPAPGART